MGNYFCEATTVVSSNISKSLIISQEILGEGSADTNLLNKIYSLKRLIWIGNG